MNIQELQDSIGKREIKYHCWDVENKQWAHIDIDDWGNARVPVFIGYPKDKPEIFELRSDRQFVWLQFTGLKDKNEKEIYEGDIIECELHKGLPTTKDIPPEELTFRLYIRFGGDASFHAIRLNDRGTCYSVGFSGSACKRWQIIGNIFENPELLKENE